MTVKFDMFEKTSKTRDSVALTPLTCSQAQDQNRGVNSHPAPLSQRLAKETAAKKRRRVRLLDNLDRAYIRRDNAKIRIATLLDELAKLEAK